MCRVSTWFPIFYSRHHAPCVFPFPIRCASYSEWSNGCARRHSRTPIFRFVLFATSSRVAIYALPVGLFFNQLLAIHIFVGTRGLRDAFICADVQVALSEWRHDSCVSAGAHYWLPHGIDMQCVFFSSYPVCVVDLRRSWDTRTIWVKATHHFVLMPSWIYYAIPKLHIVFYIDYNDYIRCVYQTKINEYYKQYNEIQNQDSLISLH